MVHKTFGDSFEGTDLEERVLAKAGVGHLVVLDAQTDQCIRNTIGAFTRGYDVTLVGDARTTEDLSEWGALRLRTR